MCMAFRVKEWYKQTMQMIELTKTFVTSTTHDIQKNEYVLYTGGIAGITDITVLESHSESLQRRPDEVEFHRK